MAKQRRHTSHQSSPQESQDSHSEDVSSPPSYDGAIAEENEQIPLTTAALSKRVTDRVSSITEIHKIYHQHQRATADFALALMETMHSFVGQRHMREPVSPSQHSSEAAEYVDAYRLVAEIARSRVEARLSEDQHPPDLAFYLVAAVYDRLAMEVDASNTITGNDTAKSDFLKGRPDTTTESSEEGVIAAQERFRIWINQDHVVLKMDELCRYNEYFTRGFRSALMDTFRHVTDRNGTCVVSNMWNTDDWKLHAERCRFIALVARRRAVDRRATEGRRWRKDVQPSSEAFDRVAERYDVQASHCENYGTTQLRISAINASNSSS